MFNYEVEKPTKKEATSKRLLAYARKISSPAKNKEVKKK